MKIILVNNKGTQISCTKTSESLPDILETIVNMLRLYGYPHLDYRLAIEELQAIEKKLDE